MCGEETTLLGELGYKISPDSSMELEVPIHEPPTVNEQETEVNGPV
jgi:hypothetical protein